MVFSTLKKIENQNFPPQFFLLLIRFPKCITLGVYLLKPLRHHGNFYFRYFTTRISQIMWQWNVNDCWLALKLHLLVQIAMSIRLKKIRLHLLWHLVLRNIKKIDNHKCAIAIVHINHNAILRIWKRLSVKRNLSVGCLSLYHICNHRLETDRLMVT